MWLYIWKRDLSQFIAVVYGFKRLAEGNFLRGLNRSRTNQLLAPMLGFLLIDLNIVDSFDGETHGFGLLREGLPFGSHQTRVETEGARWML